MVMQLSLIYQLKTILYGNTCCLSDYCDLCSYAEFTRISLCWFYISIC